MEKRDITSIEQLILNYPWYSIGYLDIYERFCEIDIEGSQLYLERAASKVFSREVLYSIYKGSFDAVVEGDITDEPTEQYINTENVESEESNLEHKESAEYSFIPDETPRFVLAGGDYFSRNDLEQISLDRSKPLDSFIADKPSLLRGSLSSKREENQVQERVIDGSELFDDSSFYTEKLASIYAEQGFYKHALDVYAKLILLYPEKSSYFASLVQEIKAKYN